MDTGISRRLTKLRRDKGNPTQAYVAAELDILQPDLSHYERGERIPDYYVLRKLSKFYGVDPNWLRDGDKVYPDAQGNPHIAELLARLHGADGDNITDEARHLAAEVALATTIAILHSQSVVPRRTTTGRRTRS